MSTIRQYKMSLIIMTVMLITLTGTNTSSAQCNLTLSLTSTSACLGADTLKLTGASTVAQIKWQNGANTVATVTKTDKGKTVAGDSTGIGSIAATHLAGPIAVCVDGSGNIYVADKSNNRIQKWIPGATRGVTVAGDSNGTAGVAADRLNSPASIIVDASSNLYVCDEGNHRVQKFAPGSANGVTVAGDVAGTSGNANDRLYNPVGIFLDGSNHLYIADKDNNRVQKWTLGATYGITVAGDSNGTFGMTRDLLNTPVGLAVDGLGNIYIADFQNNRVQKWATGAGYGSTVAGDSAGNYSFFSNRLYGPWGLSLDGSGNLYIADFGNNRIQKWAPGATRGYTVAGDSIGNSGTTSTLLKFPTGIYVDANQNLYIADFNNNRIQKYSPNINTTYVPTTAGTYTAIVTTSSGCIDTSNSVIVNPNVTPSVILNATATSLCSTLADTFSVSPTYGGATPTYQWYVNGTAIATGVPYITSTLQNSDSVWVVMTSNATCVTPASIASSKKIITVTPSVAPSVIVQPTRTELCIGLMDSFSLSPTNGGNNPTYKWYKNGTLVNSTANYITNSLHNGDSVWVVMKSNAVCALPISIPSNKLNITIDTLPVAMITDLSQTPTDTLITGTYSHYQWLINDLVIPGENQSTYIPHGVDFCITVAVVDAHGCKDTSAPICFFTGIEEVVKYNAKLYPNPTHGTVIVEAENLEGTNIVRVLDYTGRVVYTKSINTSKMNEQLDISNYPDGIYLLTISNPSGNIVVRKIIKE